MSAIDAANKTVDIVIYEIGGPNIVGQAGAPGALMRGSAGASTSASWSIRRSRRPTAPRPRPRADQPAPAASHSTSCTPRWLAEGRCCGVEQPRFVHGQLREQQLQRDPSEDDPDRCHRSGHRSAAAGVRSAVRFPRTGVDRQPELLRLGLEQPHGTRIGLLPGCADEWAARDFFVSVTEPDLINTIASVFAPTCSAVPPAWHDAVGDQHQRPTERPGAAHLVQRLHHPCIRGPHLSRATGLLVHPAHRPGGAGQRPATHTRTDQQCSGLAARSQRGTERHADPGGAGGEDQTVDGSPARQ